MGKDWKKSMRIFTNSPKVIKRKTKEIKALSLYESYAHNVDGFSHLALRKLRVIMAGAGGLGSEVGEGLVRKGVGELIIVDHDKVELTNLNRQRFSKRDIGKHKVHHLTKRIVKEGFFNTTITGIPLKFEEAVERRFNLDGDVAICGVDSDPSRIFIAKHYYKLGIPVIFTAVSEKASNGYVFVQEKARRICGKLVVFIACHVLTLDHLDGQVFGQLLPAPDVGFQTQQFHDRARVGHCTDGQVRLEL